MPPICENNSRDSNEVELSFAEEDCLRQLPEEVAAIAATGTVTLNSNVLAGVAATGSLTVVSLPADGATVTVNGQVLTFRTAAPGANEILIAGTVNAQATSLAAAISAIAGVTAAAVAGVVNITASTPGVAGNTIALVSSSAAITRSAATLAGGAAASTVTVGGTTFTFVPSAPGAGKVLVGANVTATALALAAAINPLPLVDATAALGVVTISAATPGEDGNFLTLAVAGANIAASGGLFTGGAEATPGAQWFKTEPNTFGDFGSELTKAVRSFINPSRQRKKGRTVGEEASGGFNTDFTKSSLNRLLQGFMFADARELPTTKALAKPFGLDRVVSVAAADGYRVKGALIEQLVVGQLVFGSGFVNSANNGLKVVSAVASVQVDRNVQVTPAVVNEAVALNTDKHLEACGFEFPTGDVSLAVTSGVPSLVSTVTDFTTIANLIPGAWVFVGGDLTANRFNNNIGYGRIRSVAANAIILDDVTFVPVTEAGTGKNLRLFFGPIIRNEKAKNLIKMRSYQLERTLGEGENGQQAEYLEGAIANELSMEFPTEDKIAADLTFVACSRNFVTGDPGDELKGGVRYEAEGEEVYNTTSDLYRMRIALKSDTTANLPALVGYVSEGSLAITNNAAPNKALSVLGALDFQFGDFEVSGSLTAYFTDVSAPRSIKNDADCSFNIIGAYANYGFVFDMPLLTLSGGSLTIEKDAPIMLPIEKSAVEGAEGFTLLYQFFPYLPDAAMPE